MIALDSIPSRVFLDSCVLQLLSTYGEVVHDGAGLPANDRIHSIPGGPQDLLALRDLSLICQRASLDWVVSETSLDEAYGKGDAFHFGWVAEMMEYAGHCLRMYQSTGFAEDVTGPADARFGYLSHGDRLLLDDAIRLGCDAFLTTDRRLARNANHLRRSLGLRILTPHEYWLELRPWVGLFR